ncbi:UDP-N-acetylmuramate dehydrogenase [Microbulbifer discodermiae]|uniref:UDP-N-acetylmuramate dehydrogenase n=1 Tax=Microbulbifer sp. 2201CG32-9 TaxID=3232309 RepID=UPI00345B79B8
MIHTDVDLQPLNTLAIAAKADFFARVTSLEQLLEVLEFSRHRQLPVLPLGGGSNIVLTGDFPGLVIHLQLQGVSMVDTGEDTLVTAAAGENWHQLVMRTVEQGIGGLENLALIPGCIGAAPIQNIGAYGVELRDIFWDLTAVHIASGEQQKFSANDCQFEYRSSVFKGRALDQFVITRVRMRLPRRWVPRIDYPALQHYFNEHQLDAAEQRPDQIARAVIAIRSSKLPDPAEIPNAGSFFKNPLVSESCYFALKQRYPELVAFPAGERWKLAAGWLIERAGWRGKRLNNVGVHQRQALVLINPGRGPGAEVTRLAAEIATDIYQKFGVELEPEPRYYP